MQHVTAFVARDPQTCWRRFTDVALLAAWVPGLRRAQVIAKEKGLPVEVHFEYASSLAYTLVYRYDADRREVRWQPKLGRRDGVTGLARFEAADGGTRLVYELEHGEGRGPEERALGDIDKLVASLVAWLETG